MKTNINVAELVDAFRAQKQEQINQEAAEKAERARVWADCLKQSRAALEDLRADLVKVWELAPPTMDVVVSDLDTEKASFIISLMHRNKGIISYDVEKEVSAHTNPGAKTVYRVSHGDTGRLLLQDELILGATYNPADILVLHAEFVGKSLVDPAYAS